MTRLYKVLYSGPMGNREQLHQAAKSCLFELGYSHTSARDIASAAGVSTAAIGYHYGTKDALLTAALLETLREWGESLVESVAEAAPGSSPGEHFLATWAGRVESMRADPSLWRIQFDMLDAMDRNPRLREILADANRAARLALVSMLGDPRGESAGDDEAAQQIGSLYQALLCGVSAQQLVDAETAITGPSLVAAITSVGRMVATD